MNWYFGEKAGLSFLTPDKSPTPLLNSQMLAAEGSSVISDKKGNLLFYTNSKDVWNRNHVEMPNGKNLNGNTSSSQAAVIIPNPNNENIYYLFTITAFEVVNFQNHGLQYSVVDMSNNEWKGDVTEKNHFLFGQTIERITGTRHANGRDSWVVVHELSTNCFLSYLITGKGVDTVPVRTCIGSRYPGPARQAIGSMKISQDGTKLAAVNSHSVLGFEAFDFDNATGKVSNPLIVPISSDSSQFYGLEFSPNGSKIYISDVDGGKLYQCDISKWNVDSIRASVQIISDEFGLKLGGLQLAPNGKIYCSSYNSPKLSVVRQPDSTDCQFEARKVNLGGKISTLGLPNFITGSMTRFGIPFQVSIQASKSVVCFGDSVRLTVLSNNDLSYASIQWSGPNNFTSQVFNPVIKNIQPNQSGYYEITVIRDRDTTTAGLVVEVLQKPNIEASGINFPNIPLGMKKQDSVFVKNRGSSTVQITAKVMNSPSDFSIISPTPFPVSIPPNDSVTIVIEFAPKSLIYYRDSLIVTAVNPCSSVITSYSIKGKGIDSIKNIDTTISAKDTVICVFSMPHTSAKIDDRNHVIPLHAYHTGKYGTVKLKKLRINVTFDGDIYLPRIATSMNIEKRTWNDNNLTLTLLIDSIFISSEKQQIGSLKGTVLLSSKEYTPLTFSDITFTTDSIKVLIDTIGGSITTNLMSSDICAKGLRTVTAYKPMQFNLLPNPVTDEITISYSLPFDARVTISLLSSTAEIGIPLIDSPHTAGEYKCSIPLSGRDIASGVYFMKMTAGTLTTVRKVIITR
ncbi:MAG: hypothetical protein JST20_12500 [Bacteroidetes bacterium]|nr:hypothetical protein [Bacteroidota bacterium]